ncbi:HORMA domain-containing protein [Xylaria arbuscula]|nr:HORMA domain-containing protein [Xylaria arbuscula]
MAAPNTSPPPTADQSITTPQATRLLTTFADFLTVCIHNILYYRNLYPPSTFLTSRAYNLPVHQSRHPAVCAWIRDAVDAARAQLAQGTIERLAIVIYGPSAAAVLERWMFDVAQFPAWGGLATRGDEGDGTTESASTSDDDDDDDDDDDEDEDDDDDPEAGDEEKQQQQQKERSNINWTNIDEQLRAAVRRLAYGGENMTPLPEGCTFTVVLELRDEAEAPIGHPQPWVATQPSLQTVSKDQPASGGDVGGAKTTALRAVEAAPLFFECWVEEGKAKFDLLSTRSSEK